MVQPPPAPPLDKRPLLPRRTSSNRSSASSRPPLSLPLPLPLPAPSASLPGARAWDALKALSPPQPERTSLRRSVGLSMQRSQPDADALPAPDSRSPFRRSHSKPEYPTSNVGARAIEEASHAHARANGKKLLFMRNFSVSEEDVVVCNRVRLGVNPSHLRQRDVQDRRYLRSLSVEESRLIATRRRSNLASLAVPEHLQEPHEPQEKRSKTETATEEAAADDEDPFPAASIRPAPDALRATALGAAKLPMSPRALTSPRSRAEDESTPSVSVSSSKELLKADVAGLNASTLTPREKAMHGQYLIRESFANGSYGKVCAGQAVASRQEVAVKIVPKYVLISPEEKQSVIREQIIHNKNETSLPFAGVFGTPGYIAPELLVGDATYGPAIDMFSAGVLLFEMVLGYAPFYPPSSCTYMPLEFPRDCNASPQVRHLLSKLLQRDPALRLTASQALGHPWVTLGAFGRSEPSSPVTSPRMLSIPTPVW
ncbi:hypothetical protein PybrP1_009587 [[Pythium] brassicae (nom. inval.)]|nr:hypothetical protein PybrP1_009587 [[Pythium] brassicae (nom. inval.)]